MGNLTSKESLTVLFSELTIPDNAVRYILLQRTDYLVLPRQGIIKSLRKLSPWPTMKMMAMMESIARKRTVKELYLKGLCAEYEEFAAYLPDTVSAVLDIGCGVGGINLFLYDQFGRKADIGFYLLDKTEISYKLHYGFRGTGAFYNSLGVSVTVLLDNGIARDNIFLLEAAPDNRIDIDEKLDLVISLISWGFHFPVATYIDLVYRLLSDDGCLILDIRKGTGGLDELAHRFPRVQIIAEDEKKTRVVATKYG
jgi:SAM-dependent methyltransferase